jgi:hypothetical protein
MSTTNFAGTQIVQHAGEARAEDKGRKGAPFFEVSKIVPSPDMLKGWVEWFKALNIPCAVMKTRRGYVLWRKGEEVGRTRSKTSSELTPKNIIYSFGI